LERIGTSRETVVLFESPGRVTALLTSLKETCGPKRPVAVARELTKLHEEFVRGPIEEVMEHFLANSPRGEFVVVLAGVREEAPHGPVDEAATRALAQALLDEGVSPSKAAKEVARRLGVPRNLAYEVVQQVAAERPSNEVDTGPSDVPPLARGEDG
jgi:16S rRNA (cytidine1402-2'-O)-methyltransferase